jgi:hypothetical protein
MKKSLDEGEDESKSIVATNVSISSLSSDSQNLLSNLQLMNLFQQNPLLFNLYNNLKNAQNLNLGQLYPPNDTNNNNSNNNNNMNVASSNKNVEVTKTKHNANSENPNERSSSGDAVFKRKKNEPIASSSELSSAPPPLPSSSSASISELANSQITNSDSDLGGKDVYTSKIKPHRHHHHRGPHRQRENAKKTDNDLAKQTNLNTSISSSFTSTSSVSALTGASSSASSSPSSSSPSLTSSSSVTSSEPSSPSISPNLDTRANVTNGVKEATSSSSSAAAATAFTNNVNAKLRKLTKSHTIQHEDESVQESFDATNNENLMRFTNNNKLQFSQSISVPKLTMPFAFLG